MITFDIQSEILIFKVTVSLLLDHMQIDDADVQRTLHLKETSAHSGLHRKYFNFSLSLAYVEMHNKVVCSSTVLLHR